MNRRQFSCNALLAASHRTLPEHTASSNDRLPWHTRT